MKFLDKEILAILASSAAIGGLYYYYHCRKEYIPKKYYYSDLPMQITGANSDPCLFQIEKDGKVSLLMGTHHDLPPEYLSPYILDKLVKCESFIREYSRFHAKQNSLPEKLIDLLSDTHSDVMLHEIYDEFSPVIQNKIQHLMLRLEQQKPKSLKASNFVFNLNNTPVWLLQFSAVFLDEKKGIENHIENKLTTENNPEKMLSLDSHYSRQQCYSILLKEYKEEHRRVQIEYGKSALKNYLAIHFNHWLEGEIPEALWKSAENYLITTLDRRRHRKDEHDSVMLDHRNLEWIPKILEYHSKKKNPVFLVGAAHLAGQLGLITLLKDEGFLIRKMNKIGQFDLFEYEHEQSAKTHMNKCTIL